MEDGNALLKETYQKNIFELDSAFVTFNQTIFKATLKVVPKKGTEITNHDREHCSGIIRK